MRTGRADVYLRRADDQVEIGGVRIEPAEVVAGLESVNRNDATHHPRRTPWNSPS